MPFLQDSDSSSDEFSTKTLHVYFTTDGKYLIRHGTFHANGKDWPMELTYKKEGPEYLLYHDEFEYE